jgi:hypothetical protein
MVKHNLIYDLLQSTKLSSSTVEINQEKCIDQIYFVICNSSHWCATYFGINASLLSSSLSCHGCASYNTEFMPIITDESFRIEYNPTRG